MLCLLCGGYVAAHAQTRPIKGKAAAADSGDPLPALRCLHHQPLPVAAPDIIPRTAEMLEIVGKAPLRVQKARLRSILEGQIGNHRSDIEVEREAFAQRSPQSPHGSSPEGGLLVRLKIRALVDVAQGIQHHADA